MQTMESIFTNLKNTFRAGNILAKLIYINVGLFILIRLMGVIFLLFNIPGISFLQYLQMPSSPELLMYRPWTVITYMFTHFDFLHILFNMLWLYWFGGLFLTFFSERCWGDCICWEVLPVQYCLCLLIISFRIFRRWLLQVI